MDCLNIINAEYLSASGDQLVRYVGDSLTGLAYDFRFADMGRFFSLIVDIPQHHYFVDPGVNWCMALTLTNNFEFGFAGGKVKK